MAELLSRLRPVETSASEDRVYFAALPDANAKADIARLGSKVRRDYRLAEEPFDIDRLHVSLCFVGKHAEITDAIVGRARMAASAVRTRPFAVSFNCITRFSTGVGKRPLVLIGDDGVGGLTALHMSLGVAMREVGFAARARDAFTPHVTLMYGALPIDEQMIRPIGWTVRDFVLVHSLHGKRRHIHLDRWPLRT